MANSPAPSATTTRRSANYGPTSWSHDFILSLASGDSTEEEKLTRKIKELENDVRGLFAAASAPALLLELVDAVGQLGVAYLFEEEVKAALDFVSANKLDVLVQLQGDLHAIALLFRLLRDNGYEVTQDVFFLFLSEDGKFKPSLLHHPTALVSLYEASYYAFDGEDTLDEAREFTSAGLNAFLVRNQQSPDHQEASPLQKRKIAHALELPVRWRMPRLQTRWFIDVYSEEHGGHSALLELAKLDFSRQQIIHRNELAEASRWWKKLALIEKMPFSRDRVVECFLFSMGGLHEPQFGYLRVRLTKVFCLMMVIDDLYDIYGTLDELKLFTESVERWDMNQIVQLPEYVKLCFLALFNDVNEVVYEMLRDNGIDLSHYFKKMWADLCKSYLVEATWYKDRYIPKVEEYIENGWVSIGYPVIMLYMCALASGKTIHHETMEFFCGSSDFIRCNSIISRLVGDMGTARYENKRGDVTKAVECYMAQEVVSEKSACVHIHGLVRETWKKVNREKYNNSCFPKTLVEGAISFTKIVHCVYLYGDGFGFPIKYNKDQVMSLLIETIS